MLAFFSLGGCATNPALRGVVPVAELTDVPFFAQDDYQCGPAALATVLTYSGVAVTPQQLEPRVYIPNRLGSLQAELLSTARSFGRVPYRISGEPDTLLQSLRADQPVLVLQNIGLSFAPIWHYAVLVGFDSNEQDFVLRSGTVQRHTMSARRFMASWQRAENWAFVVVPASAPPASATALSWLEAVAPFESIGSLDIATDGYLAAVQRWPDEPRVWTALGNVRYLSGDLTAAEQAYSKALALAPEHWIARNNLVHTLIAQGCPDQARAWADTVGQPPTDFATTWQNTLNTLSSTPQSSCQSVAGKHSRTDKQ